MARRVPASRKVLNLGAIALPGLALALALPHLPLPPPGPQRPHDPEAFRATVLSVGDGDSLRVLRDGRRLTIRLACIDAPELRQVPYGARARDVLRLRLSPGREVRILPHDRDRHGRTVAEVIDGINVGLAMVEDGWAFVFPRYVEACDAEEYRQAEFRASRHRFGVWQLPGGIERPWRFRRQQRR